jgi:hypothetical protein
VTQPGTTSKERYVEIEEKHIEYEQDYKDVGNLFLASEHKIAKQAIFDAVFFTLERLEGKEV